MIQKKMIHSLRIHLRKIYIIKNYDMMKIIKQIRNKGKSCSEKKIERECPSTIYFNHIANS